MGLDNNISMRICGIVKLRYNFIYLKRTI